MGTMEELADAHAKVSDGLGELTELIKALDADLSAERQISRDAIHTVGRLEAEVTSLRRQLALSRGVSYLEPL